jgi:Fe-S-cluster containining protein
VETVDLTKSVNKTGICRNCGNCCRYFVFEPWQFKFDMNWLHVIGGKMSGKYALIHRPCPHLKGNDCVIYDHRPWFCQDWPGKYEDCNHEWMESVGCNFFKEERDALKDRESTDSDGDSGASAGETLQTEQGYAQNVEGAT